MSVKIHEAQHEVSPPLGASLERTTTTRPEDATTARQRPRAAAGPHGAAALQGTLGNRVLSHVLTASRRAAGGGQPLPTPLRARAEQALARDFSRVRVHDDDAAAGMSRGLAAHAFTVGPDIYFAAGRYQPNQRGGAWLLAHEMAHVAQQVGGPALQPRAELTPVNDLAERRADAAADAFLAGRPVPDVGTIAAGAVSRVVVTNGGVFDTTQYQPTAEIGTLGASIRLRFTPNNLVPRGDKIGIIQTVNSYTGANPSFADELNRRAALAAGSLDPGRAVDRVETGDDDVPNTNPVYGAQNRRGHVARQLTDNAPTGDDQLGSRSWFGANVPARLADDPGLPRGRNRGQRFEAAAVMLEGSKVGLYLGSVAWGWAANAAGTAAVLTPNPLELVSRGAPSAAFMAAGQAWNTLAVNGGQNLVRVPTNAAPAAARELTAMTDHEIQAAIDAIDAQITAAVNVAGGRRQLKLEKAALLAEKQRRGMFFGVDLGL